MTPRDDPSPTVPRSSMPQATQPADACVDRNAGHGAAETIAAPPSKDQAGPLVVAAPDAAAKDVPVEWNVGDVILDTYEVRQVHTGGAIGLVYRVRHRDWDQEMAVKSPRPRYFDNDAHKENFVRECLTWVGLGLHQHIVCCYYVRVLGGIPRVFAEYVEGGSLQDWIKDKRLYAGEPQEVLARMLDIAIQFAWGLHYAHEQGLVHQDVKPANVMLTPDGIAKVSDFGLAKARAAANEPAAAGEQQNALVTYGGKTPAYCSPEQANKQPLSRKTDIWSWAVSVLEMFNGGVSWMDGQAAPKALENYLELGAEDTHIPKMPARLVTMLRRCFKRNPADRPGILDVVTRLKRTHATDKGIRQPYERPDPKPAEALADALNNQAISLLDLGQKEEAEQAFEKAMKADPHHPETTYNLGLLHWRSARITDAQLVAQLEEVRRSHPDDWRDEYLLALVHLERGDAESAVKLLKEASERSSGNRQIRRALSMAQNPEATWGRCLREFKGHREHVTAVAISPDGRRALSGSRDKTLRLWELATGRCLRVFDGTDMVSSVAISPDSRWALSGYHGHKALRAWELSTGRCLRTLEGHTDEVNAVAIRSDGRWALSGSRDTTLRLWDLATGMCLRKFEGHTDTVESVAISPDGHWALSGSGNDEKVMRLWDLTTGRCLRKFEGHDGPVDSVAISPDGRWVLSGSGDMRVRLWELATGRCLRTLEGHANGVTSVAISPDGRRGLSGNVDGKLRLWNLTTGQCLRTFEGHNNQVVCVAVSPDGRWGLSGSWDKTLRRWELEVGLPQGIVEAFPRTATHVSDSARRAEALIRQASEALHREEIDTVLSHLTQARAIAGYERHPALMDLWQSAGSYARRIGLRAVWRARSFEGHTEYAESLAISPDARWALSGSRDKTLRLWELATGRCLRTFAGHTSGVRSVAMSPNGCWALSGGGDKVLRLWDLSTGQCLRTFEKHTASVASVAISPDGQWGLWSDDKTLRLWDLSTGQCLRTFEGHTAGVASVAISPDGRWGLSGGIDRRIRLWELATGRCLRVLEGHRDIVESLAIGPDGRRGLSGSSDFTLRLWDLSTDRCLRAFEGHTYPVTSVAVAADSRWALSGSWDNTIRLWDLASGQCLRQLEGHTHLVTSIAISPDCRWVLSGGDDNTLWLWELDWEYEFPGWAEWDEAARPYLAIFLTLHCGLGADGISRTGKPSWADEDFQKLMKELQHRGYGWLRPEGVRRELEKMTREWKGPPPLPGGSEDRPVDASPHEVHRPVEQRATPHVRQDRIHVVRKGDTLQRISWQYYRTLNEWRRIYEANREVLAGNPNEIEVGVKLTIPYLTVRPPKTEASAALRTKEIAQADTLLAIARGFMQRGQGEELRKILAARLPKLSLRGGELDCSHLLVVQEAQLDIKRGILWVTGDTGITLACSMAYPYDLYGRHLSPGEVVTSPSDAWWGYGDGRSPVGLLLRGGVDVQNLDSVRLVDAPGNDTLVYEDSAGQRYVIDYNGNPVPDTDSASAHSPDPRGTESPDALQDTVKSPSPQEADTLIKTRPDRPVNARPDATILRPLTKDQKSAVKKETTCPRCDNKVAADVTFCLHCGELLTPAPSQRASTPPELADSAACSCGFANPPGNAFCNKCGKPLSPVAEVRCRHCDKVVPAHVDFCVHCGRKL